MFTREDFQSIRALDQITTLHPKDFEWFCKFFLEQRGHAGVQVTQKHGKYKGDGGVDTVSFVNGEKVYGQCKRWNPNFWGCFNGRLPVRVVRELGGCMLRDGVKKGVMLTTLEYDDTDKREATQMNIELIGRQEIALTMKVLVPTFRTGKRFGVLRMIGKIIVVLLKMLLRGIAELVLPS